MANFEPRQEQILRKIDMCPSVRPSVRPCLRLFGLQKWKILVLFGASRSPKVGIPKMFDFWSELGCDSLSNRVFFLPHFFRRCLWRSFQCFLVVFLENHGPFVSILVVGPRAFGA